jgi:hypothetical protein
MPTLLAESILTATSALLTSALSGVVVERGRVDELPASSLPAVGVFQGPDEPAVEESAWPFMDSYLEIRTELAAAAATGSALDTALNELRRRVHFAIMAENALNLGYVVDIMPEGVDEPESSGESERVKGTMVCRWVVHYRHKWNDAGEAP